MTNAGPGGGWVFAAVSSLLLVSVIASPALVAR